MSILTEKQALLRSRATCLTNVKNLNCWGSNLEDISLVSQMINLEVLNISVNNISSMKSLSYCPRLKELYLRKNQISDVSELKYLKNLKGLQVLWLADNPCEDTPNYKETVLQNLPNLKKLDNMDILTEDIEAALKAGDLLIGNNDENIPNFDGLDLNHTLTMDTVLAYTSITNEQKPALEKNLPSVRTPLALTSVDDEEATGKVGELGSCDMKLNSIEIENPAVVQEEEQNPFQTSMTSPKNSTNSHVFDAVLLLLNDLSRDDLEKVIVHASNLVKAGDEDLDCREKEFVSSG